MVDIPWTLNCNIVEDLMFFYSPLWIQLFIVHAHWTCKCNFLLSHFILIIYFNNSWKKISDLMTFKSNLWSQFIKLACQSFMFPCTVHDFLMMSTNDALLWRFVFVYLELSLYLCFLVIKIHVYINLYKRVCYSNKFCNVFY